MNFIKVLGLLAGGWGAYKVYENISKPKGKVSFGELNFEGVDIENFSSQEALRKFETQKAMLKSQFDSLDAEGIEYEKWIFIELCKLIKSGKMAKNHAASIMANVMIECHFKLMSEDPHYTYKTKTGEQPYLKYKGNPAGYFNARYGYSTSVGKTLGNRKPNDGYNFRGRGFCQLTGRELYERASRVLGIDFVSNPELVLQKEYAFKIAVAFFMGWNGGFFTGVKNVLPNLMPNGSTDFIKSRLLINPGEVRNPKKYADKLSAVNRFGNAYLKIFNTIL